MSLIQREEELPQVQQGGPQHEPRPGRGGPALAGAAMVATTFIGANSEAGAWASGVAALGGTLVAVVNMVGAGGHHLRRVLPQGAGDRGVPG
jgi:hypothetical protein